MFIDDPFRDCRLKPEPDVKVLAEISLFVQQFGCFHDREQAMFTIMVENRGEA